MFTRHPFSLLCNNIRCIYTTVNVFGQNHYEVLGITAKATQSEIKAAYYKLSKVYHPDKNQGSADAAVKFRDITAAYEILGNVRTRRLYDKGVRYEQPPYQHPADEDDPKTRFYRSRERRHRPPPPTGKTPIYDFDEWSKAHYGATFARDMERKHQERLNREMRMADENAIRIERTLLVFLIFVGVSIYFSRDDYDIVNIKTNETKPP